MSKEYHLVALGDGQCMRIAYGETYPQIKEYLDKRRKCAYRKARPFYKKFTFPLSDA